MDASSDEYTDDVKPLRRYPSKMHRIGAEELGSSMVQEKLRKKSKVKQKPPARNLDFQNLPPVLLSPRDQRYAYPEPRVPFPPTVGAPHKRRQSVDHRAQAALELLQEGRRFAPLASPKGVAQSALALQHLVEWEATRRMNITWEEMQRFQQHEKTWRRYGVKHHKVIKNAIEHVINEERLAEQRRFKEVLRFLDEEAAARVQLEKSEMNRFKGIENKWERVIVQYISYTETVLRNQERREAKTFAKTKHDEGHERLELVKAERLNRIAAAREMARETVRIKQEALREAYDRKREEQMNKSAGPLVRRRPPSPAATSPYETTKVKTYKSVNEYKEEVEQEHQEGVFVHVKKKEANERSVIVIAEASALKVILSAHKRTSQFDTIVQTAKSAKIHARHLLAQQAEVIALGQDEVTAREVLVREWKDSVAGLQRKEIRAAFRMWRKDEETKSKHNIHIRKLHQHRAKAVLQQQKLIVEMRQQSSLQKLVIAEHLTREAFAKHVWERLDALLEKGKRAARKSMMMCEAGRRSALEAKEAHDFEGLRHKARHGKAFLDLCVITGDVIYERQVRNLKAQLRSHMLHTVRREQVEREEAVKAEETLRNTILRECRWEAIGAWERSQQAEERRRIARDTLLKRKKDVEARTQTLALISAHRAKQAMENEFYNFLRSEKRARRSLLKSEKYELSDIRLLHFKANPPVRQRPASFRAMSPALRPRRVRRASKAAHATPSPAGWASSPSKGGSSTARRRSLQGQRRATRALPSKDTVGAASPSSSPLSQSLSASGASPYAQTTYTHDSSVSYSEDCTAHHDGLSDANSTYPAKEIERDQDGDEDRGGAVLGDVGGQQESEGEVSGDKQVANSDVEQQDGSERVDAAEQEPQRQGEQDGDREQGQTSSGQETGQQSAQDSDKGSAGSRENERHAAVKAEAGDKGQEDTPTGDARSAGEKGEDPQHEVFTPDEHTTGEQAPSSPSHDTASRSSTQEYSETPTSGTRTE